MGLGKAGATQQSILAAYGRVWVEQESDTRWVRARKACPEAGIGPRQSHREESPHEEAKPGPRGLLGPAVVGGAWEGAGPTVQLYLTQSSQKRLAENFLRSTTVRP